eukprot:scaffold189429_cov34-Tisochrysis_lutea.AAC.1
MALLVLSLSLSLSPSPSIAGGGRTVALAHVRSGALSLCSSSELRAAKAAAAEAANAEARLRAMLAAAARNVAALERERDEAVGQAETLRLERDRAITDLQLAREEADAAASLAAQDIQALDETIAELQALLKASAARVENGVTASVQAALKAAEERVGTLESELTEARRQAVFAKDELAEWRARCELAEADLDGIEELRNEIEELRLKIGQSHQHGLAGADSVLSEAGRISTLEAQVADLLTEVDGLSQGNSELMEIRPQAAKAHKYRRMLQEAGIPLDD